jgi:TetR/AcrR family transcriptional regulator, repressor for uid operon
MEPTGSHKRGRPSATTPEDTRSQIVRAARAVFSERGYDATTFQAIAQRANLTSPAITHYFPNKLVLYRAVVDRTSEIVARAGVKQAEQGATLIEQLSQFIMMSIYPGNVENPSLSSFAVVNVLESTRNPELSGAADEHVIITRDFLIRAVADAIERGEIGPDTDVVTMADTLMLIQCGVAFYARYVRHYKMSDEEVQAVTTTLRQLLQGASSPQPDT